METATYMATTTKSFEDALSSVIAALDERKFGVMWRLNFRDRLREKGLEFDTNYEVLEVCNPPKAKEVLSRHLDAGVFLPCKVVVYEEGDQVKIGMVRPRTLLGLLGHDELDNTAKEVEDTLIAAIDAAV